ncbi:MAG: alpha/beta hydrolase-fold protein [Gemmataceae bacterium]
MKSLRLLAAVCAVVIANPAAAIDFGLRNQLDRINRQIAGRLLDFTHNHGVDRRIWSPALCQKRDVYVYLPPGYDPCLAYPVIFYMHGITQDESQFIGTLVGVFDKAMACGKLPPSILVVADGSIQGEPSLFNSGSFYINSKAGRFEDYFACDVWDFVHANFKIRPEREAHALIGASMGGCGAFSLAFRRPQQYGIIVGVFPAVNLLWEDCHGRYLGNFSPCCQGYRTSVQPHEVIARFYGGLLRVRSKTVMDPLFGRDPDSLRQVAAVNPYDLLETCDVRDGQFAMHISYGGRDEFNVDAQVESFLWRARQRGICIGVQYDPRGHHNIESALKYFPAAADWLAPRLATYPPIGR